MPTVLTNKFSQTTFDIQVEIEADFGIIEYYYFSKVEVKFMIIKKLQYCLYTFLNF
jgi:hypothetical protein